MRTRFTAWRPFLLSLLAFLLPTACAKEEPSPKVPGELVSQRDGVFLDPDVPLPVGWVLQATPDTVILIDRAVTSLGIVDLSASQVTALDLNGYQLITSAAASAEAVTLVRRDRSVVMISTAGDLELEFPLDRRYSVAVPLPSARVALFPGTDGTAFDVVDPLSGELEAGRGDGSWLRDTCKGEPCFPCSHCRAVRMDSLIAIVSGETSRLIVVDTLGRLRKNLDLGGQEPIREWAAADSLSMPPAPPGAGVFKQYLRDVSFLKPSEVWLGVSPSATLFSAHGIELWCLDLRSENLRRFRYPDWPGSRSGFGVAVSDGGLVVTVDIVSGHPVVLRTPGSG